MVVPGRDLASGFFSSLFSASQTLPQLFTLSEGSPDSAALSGGNFSDFIDST